MIKLCPHCGNTLGRMLCDGISSCDTCNQVFDASLYYETLSAAWVVRNWNIHDAHFLKWKFGFSEESISIVEHYIIDQCLSHDEFLPILKQEIHLDRLV